MKGHWNVFEENLEEYGSGLSNKNVKAGGILNMPYCRVFNFSDNEENYFAVIEKTK
jgi:lactoylglutathione lyase